MTQSRIRGEDVEVMLVAGGQQQDLITDIKSLEITLDLQVLSEGFLGETTMRKDDIFNGVSGRIEMHFSDIAVFKLLGNIVNRARRRMPGFTVNIKGTFRFPNGQVARCILPNVKFGQVPISFGDRAAYGSITLPFENEDLTVLTTAA